MKEEMKCEFVCVCASPPCAAAGWCGDLKVDEVMRGERIEKVARWARCRLYLLPLPCPSSTSCLI